MASKMTLAGDVDFQVIAKKTPGFVGADLSSLTKEAAVVAINRIFTRLRATNPSSSTDSAACDGDTGLGLAASEPSEARRSDVGSSANGEAMAAAQEAEGTTPGLPPRVSATNERGGSGGHSDGSSTKHGAYSTLQQGSKKTRAGGASEEEAEAVGGFLSKPLSAAQLAPLSVTMEDFMMAVKKVRRLEARFLVCLHILGGAPRDLYCLKATL